MSKSKQPVEAMADCVIVVRPQPKDESLGGIAIPEAAKKDPHYGKVLAVGPEVKNQDLVGKIVIFSMEAGWRVKVTESQELDLWWMPEMSLLLSMSVAEAKKRGFDIPKDSLDTLVKV